MRTPPLLLAAALAAPLAPVAPVAPIAPIAPIAIARLEPQEESARPFGVELPAGPAARAWSAVGAGTRPARLEPEDVPPAPLDAEWRTARPWLAWAEAIRAEASAATPDPRRRARLALLAWQQGRSDDAWDHLSACTAGPEWFAAALPALLPGVPREVLASGAGARDGVLPEGIVLTPALPPPDRPAREVVLGTGRIERRSMTIDGVRIGGASVSLTVALGYDGVQVELAHRSGAPVRFAVRLPEPPDFEIRLAYVDWERQETALAPLAVALAPLAEPVVLFGRFVPRQIEWPTSLPEALPRQIARDGIRLELGPRDPGEPRCAGFAAGLGALLECAAEARALDPSAPPEPWPGLALHFREGPGRERKLSGIASLAERYVLGARR